MPTSKNVNLQAIKNHLIKNPIDRTSKNPYGYAADLFKTDKETIRSVWRSLRKNGKVADESVNSQKTLKQVRTQDSTGLSITTDSDTDIKTLEDLLVICNVDGELWEIVSWQCKKWDLGVKNKHKLTPNDPNIETKCLFSVSAKFRPKKVENNLELQKDIIMKELFDNAPNLNVLKQLDKFDDAYNEFERNTAANCLLEICLFDVHFGKLAHAEESGEDFDLKIATQRFKSAIADLISRVNTEKVERILFPIGNDMINVDGSSNLTTAGTPQTCDSRFYKVVRSVKNLLIETINELAVIAPVDVIVVQGNHDTQTMFMIGEMLEAYYHNLARVTIANEHKFRKYYQYGNTSIQFTHGNNEAHTALGLIFATEEPLLWAETKFRYCQLGHFHHSKTMKYVNVGEQQGFTVQIIPSLTSNDAWHTMRGYNSLRQAKAFLFDFNDGLVAEYTHTSKI